jgi:ubiquinone/menaquinone biosynthesis C-methylase UbiE
MTQTNCTCTVEKCDIFDFMAKYVGLSVLHPGGFVATGKLIDKCHINARSRVLDIACGKGTSSIMIAKKFGCRVTGIDISEELITEAKLLAEKHKVSDLTEFLVGDATNLPFGDHEYDVTISQAMLVLIDDQCKVIEEALRVLKTNGFAGWIELTWQKEPSDGFIQQVSDVICAYCMLNVNPAEGWKDLFVKSGAEKLNAEIYPMAFNGMKGMLQDEGFRNSIRVMKRYLTDSKVRKRMKTMNRFFKNHEEIFGYGIYTMTKSGKLAA